MWRYFFFYISHPIVLKYIKESKSWNNLYTFKVYLNVSSSSNITASPTSNLFKDKFCDKITTTLNIVEIYNLSNNFIQKFDSISDVA